MVFGPSLAELFVAGGIDYRLAAVDRFTILPDSVQVQVAGDFLSPSLELIYSLGTTSIHVIGTNQSLVDLADRMGIPYYNYSFDTLDDVFEVCRELESRYPDAELDEFIFSVEHKLDSVAGSGLPRISIMPVIYFQEDGAITVAGRGTFFEDIITGIGCEHAAPETGTYPMVSVEGVMEMAPDIIIVFAPGADSEEILNRWEGYGLGTDNVTVLNGDHVLMPGSHLPELIVEISRCLE